MTAARERQEKLSNDIIYSETLQHLHACQQFCRMFQGREEVVERVHQYVVGKSDQPFVMFGQSGCGKTSLMAKSASQVSLESFILISLRLVLPAFLSYFALNQNLSTSNKPMNKDLTVSAMYLAPDQSLYRI